MRLRAYAVRDAKAEAYLRPFFADTRGVAVRSFSDAVNDGSSPFFAHPEDYSLWELGAFDQESGVLVCELVALGQAVSYKKEV